MDPVPYVKFDEISGLCECKVKNELLDDIVSPVNRMCKLSVNLIFDYTTIYWTLSIVFRRKKTRSLI